MYMLNVILCISSYFCLCFLLKTTHVLISPIIVATCRTTRTAITASSEVELPLLLVVEYISVYMHGIQVMRFAVLNYLVN